MTARADWSAYQNDSWKEKPPGTHGIQPRVLHLLQELGRNPRYVPASNVVFVRSRREAELRAEKDALLRACWPVHEAVIDHLGVRTIVCFGRTAGKWVRGELIADELVDSFNEKNERRWVSQAHLNAEGCCVITLTHPSVAKWDAPESDPTELVRGMLER